SSLAVSTPDNGNEHLAYSGNVTGSTRATCLPAAPYTPGRSALIRNNAFQSTYWGGVDSFAGRAFMWSGEHIEEGKSGLRWAWTDSVKLTPGAAVSGPASALSKIDLFFDHVVEIGSGGGQHYLHLELLSGGLSFTRDTLDLTLGRHTHLLQKLAQRHV